MSTIGGEESKGGPYVDNMGMPTEGGGTGVTVTPRLGASAPKSGDAPNLMRRTRQSKGVSMRNLAKDRPRMPKRKAKWNSIGNICRALSRSLAILLFLAVTEFLAISTYCWGIWWVLEYDCVSLTGVSCSYSECSPSNMTVALIMVGCNVLIPLFWFVGEMIVNHYNRTMANEGASGRAWQKSLDEWERRAGYNPGAYRVPRHTTDWNSKLSTWYTQQKVIVRKLNAGVRRRAFLFYGFFLLVGYVLLLLVFSISPQAEDPDEQFYSPVVGLFLIETNGFYDVLLIIVMIWEVFLFLLVLAFIEWPQKKQARNMTPRTLAREAHKLQREESFRYKDDTQGLIADTALCIAAHDSCLTPDRERDFRKTLTSAMKLFPATHIFVCDNGKNRTPSDRTEQVCDEVSRSVFPDLSQRINYLYVPEGNKSHAIYWCTELWIPLLIERGLLHRNFTWCMMIDDDVQLPSDLQIPLRALKDRPNTKAISFAIRAVGSKGQGNALVQLQDAEYKVAGAIKQFQSRYGTTLYCHGAIGLWRRDTLGKNILWYHDTEFHGEDMYMGLLLHRMKKNYKIEAHASVVVPTTAPETFSALFRQRTTSWDLCAHRKVLSYFKFLMFTWHKRTLVLKPFIFYEVMVAIQDYIRVYLLVGLAFRNYIGLGLLFGFYYILTWLEMILFNKMVLRRREDLRIGGVTIFLFPAYKTISLLFRYHALLRNAMMYVSLRRKKFTICDRFTNKDGLLPVPFLESAKPDWFTVWKPDSQPVEDLGGAELRRELEEKVIPKIHKWLNAGSKARIVDLLEAYYRHCKMKLEFNKLLFPAILKNIPQIDRQDIAQLHNDLKELNAAIECAVEVAVGPSYNEVYRTTEDLAREHHAEGRHVVMSSKLAGLEDPNAIDVYENLLEASRLAVLDMKWATSRTTYPQHQSQVTGAIQAADDVAESIEIILSSPPFGSGVPQDSMSEEDPSDVQFI